MIKIKEQTLEQIETRLSAALKLSNADLSGWDPRTRPSIEIAKRQAGDDVAGLKLQYEVAFTRGAVAIFLAGSEADQKEFAELAETEGGTVTVDGKAMYRRISAKVLPTIGGDKQFGTTQSFIFIMEMQDIMRELNISDWVAPASTQPATINNEADMLQLASQLVGKIGGAATLKTFIVKQATEQAIQLRYTKGVNAVVITGLGEPEREALKGLVFTGDNIVVELPEGKQVNTDTVIKAFIQLKKTKK